MIKHDDVTQEEMPEIIQMYVKKYTYLENDRKMLARLIYCLPQQKLGEPNEGYVADSGNRFEERDTDEENRNVNEREPLNTIPCKVYYG